MQNYRGVFRCFCELISGGIIKAEKFTRNFYDLVVKISNLSLPLMRGKSPRTLQNERTDYLRKKKLHCEPAKNYFPLPNGIYQLGLSAGAIAVYGYLLYIENRETYQCHASYATIGCAVGMSRNTVRKYVQELERRELILTERTTIITQDGRIQNGSLLYTILPIQLVIEQFYQEQFNAVDLAREQQCIEKLIAQNTACVRT